MGKLCTVGIASVLEATLSKMNCPPKSAPALLTGMLGFHVIAGYDSLQLLPATSSLMHIEMLPSMTSKNPARSVCLTAAELAASST